MDCAEEQIFALLQDLCKYLPIHVEKWNDKLKILKDKVVGISNLAERFRAFQNKDVKSTPLFEHLGETYEYVFIDCMERDLKIVRESVDALSRYNCHFKDKLDKLEKKSWELDWEEGDSFLLKGTPLIPPLKRVLQDSLKFYNLFNKYYQDMKQSTKHVQWTDEDSVKTWENRFFINIDTDQCINTLIAITQYMHDDNVLDF